MLRFRPFLASMYLHLNRPSRKSHATIPLHGDYRPLSSIIITIIDAISTYSRSLSSAQSSFSKTGFLSKKPHLCTFSVVRQPIHIVQIRFASFADNLDVIRSAVLYCTYQNRRWERMVSASLSPFRFLNQSVKCRESDGLGDCKSVAGKASLRRFRRKNAERTPRDHREIAIFKDSITL